MQRIGFVIFLFMCGLPGFGQEAYFQQEVNYKIEVALNDEAHTLNGRVEMEYVNHSPDELPFIYFHLWANAFGSQNTAFANQQLKNGKTDFYFAEETDWGGYSDLAFKVDGVDAQWDTYENHPDIISLSLPHILKPGGKVVITTPFELKIPAAFSRLGHQGQAYQITQWYPKPAVYDPRGWHPMPYLDMGEFYSEFGSFDVSITLPDNYVVAATGVLETESERRFLEDKVAQTKKKLQSSFPETDTFPPSSSSLKTIRYTARNVHDFAWFADKRFHADKKEVEVSSGSTVATWAFFLNENAQSWRKAADYVSRSVRFFSEKVGDYPYPHATVVEGPLGAGGGMEYPMITIIDDQGSDRDLDEIIAHEVGHNWFYGILAFNERDHPWMDEGLNSYYEYRYMQDYYGRAPIEKVLEFFSGDSTLTFSGLAFQYQASRHRDQPPQTHCNHLSQMNYFLSAYVKPTLIFKYASYYLGVERFDQIIQGFYEKWKFKHPAPEDLSRYFAEATDQNMDWCFNGLIHTNKKLDYAITSTKMTPDIAIEVVNKGGIAGPFPLAGIKDGEVVEIRWVEGFDGQEAISFPKGDYDQFVIDPYHWMPDVNRSNNQIKTKGVFPSLEKVRLRFLAGFDNPMRSTVYWTPVLGGNKYDKFMLGLGLHNRSLSAKRFDFLLAPMFGFGSDKLTGLGILRYHAFPDRGPFRKMTLGLEGKTFTFRALDSLRTQTGFAHPSMKYYRLQPALTLELAKPSSGHFYQTITLRSILLWEDIPGFDNTGIFTGNEMEQSTLFEISYSGENRRKLNPFDYRLALEQQSYKSAFGESLNYLRASLELNTRFAYRQDRNIDFRVFAGAFLANSRRHAGNVSNRGTRASFSLFPQGFNDYKYDGYFFGRTENDGVWSQQVSLEEGGFKNAFGSAFALGQSNNFIFSINMKADLPVKFPVKPYFDFGYFDNAQPTGSDDTFGDQALWSGGLMLELGDGMFGLYFPLVYSENIDNLYAQRAGGKYHGRITFSINPSKWNIFEHIERIEY